MQCGSGRISSGKIPEEMVPAEVGTFGLVSLCLEFRIQPKA